FNHSSVPVLISCLRFPQSSIPASFPYTTLFRSRIVLGDQAFDRTAMEVRIGIGGGAVGEGQLLGLDEQVHVLGAAETVGFQVMGDRKSTRLNSSHVKISYAVFCLKNKNITLSS